MTIRILFLSFLTTLLSTDFCSLPLMQKKVTWPRFSMEAHRGGRGLWPENTIVAMLKALDKNITTLEMDCHITADGKAIVTHDPTVNPQFTLTAEGTAITKEQAADLHFYKMNYQEISGYDVGSKFYGKFPRQEKIKTGIPLLADLLDSVQSHIKNTKRKQIFYNIETKISPEGDNRLHPEPREFVRLLMNVIKEKKLLDYVIIQSFDPRTLEVVHKEYPGVKTSLLVDTGGFDDNLKKLSFVPEVYSPNYVLVDRILVDDCHRKGIKVIRWTVNDRKKIKELRETGVDGIITDYPDLF